MSIACPPQRTSGVHLSDTDGYGGLRICLSTDAHTHAHTHTHARTRTRTRTRTHAELQDPAQQCVLGLGFPSLSLGLIYTESQDCHWGLAIWRVKMPFVDLAGCVSIRTFHATQLAVGDVMSQDRPRHGTGRLSHQDEDGVPPTPAPTPPLPGHHPVWATFHGAQNQRISCK